MTFTHSFQEDRLVAAEMDEPWIRDCRKDIQEFVPYPLLFVLVVCPKAMLNGTIAGSDANADQVVEIAIGQTFDIQIDRRAVEFRIQEIDESEFCSRGSRALAMNDEISPACLAICGGVDEDEMCRIAG